MAPRTFINALPNDAVQCNGDILYSLNHWVSPNGDFYKVYKTTNGNERIQKIADSGPQNAYHSFSDAMMKLDNGEMKKMDKLDGIFVRNATTTRVLTRALICYYFVERKSFTELDGIMHADLIDKNGNMIPSNLRWVSKEEQKNNRLDKRRLKVNPKNIWKHVDIPDDLDTAYIEWNNYFVKKDGTRVIKLNNDKFKEITLNTGSDGYKNITVVVGNISETIRMNRFMLKITTGITDDQHVDHIDGDITNNSLDNLEAVSPTENARRGINATSFIKVDPESMKILDEIRCIIEYTKKQGPPYNERALAARLDTFKKYNNFLWFRESSENVIYKIEDDIVKPVDINQIQANAIHAIRERVDQILTNNELTEDMLPIGGPISDDTIALLDTLDPRGVGDIISKNDTNNYIKGHCPCCILLSYYGGSDNGQVVLCTHTMLVFVRSRDNLLQTDRKCPLCTNYHEESATRMKFSPDGPESGIPIYSYTSPRRTNDNEDPSSFKNKYLTWRDFAGHDAKPGVFKSLRDSICEITTGTTGARAKCRNLIISMYPPVNNHINESSTNWILNRRINCTAMVIMKKYLQSKKTK